MSSKRSPAARVLDFFTTAPIGEATLVLGLVKEVVKKRTIAGTATGLTQVPPKRRARKAKVNAKPEPTLTGTGAPLQPGV